MGKTNSYQEHAQLVRIQNWIALLENRYDELRLNPGHFNRERDELRDEILSISNQETKDVYLEKYCRFQERLDTREKEILENQVMNALNLEDYMARISNVRSEKNNPDTLYDKNIFVRGRFHYLYICRNLIFFNKTLYVVMGDDSGKKSTFKRDLHLSSLKKPTEASYNKMLKRFLGEKVVFVVNTSLEGIIDMGPYSQIQSIIDENLEKIKL